MEDLDRAIDQSGGLLEWPTWKAGIEPPPLVATNAAVISYLVAILEGTIELAAPVSISKAIAIQLYQLVSDPFARADELKDIGMDGLYVLLASLSLGRRVDVSKPELSGSITHWITEKQ